MSIHNDLTPYVAMDIRDLAIALVDPTRTQEERNLVASAIGVKQIREIADAENRRKFLAKYCDKQAKKIGKLDEKVTDLTTKNETLTKAKEAADKTLADFREEVKEKDNAQNIRTRNLLDKAASAEVKSLKNKAAAAKAVTATGGGVSVATSVTGLVVAVACPPVAPVGIGMFAGGALTGMGFGLGHGLGTVPYAEKLDSKRWVLEHFPESQESAPIKTAAENIRQTYDTQISSAHNEAYSDLNDDTPAEREAEMDREYERLSVIAKNNLDLAEANLRLNVNNNFYI